MFKANNHIYKKHGFSKFDHTFARKKTHQNELEGWTPDRWALASGFGLKLMILACEHNNWLDMGCLTGKPAVHIQSTKAKNKDHSKGDAFKTSIRARTRQENCTFQRSPNMRVADCATVWVCKCLQLIYLSALHLPLFDIYYYNLYTKMLQSKNNQRSLSWRYDYLPRARIFVNAMICKRASQVIGFEFGSGPRQTGWPCSKHESQRQNCWDAVEVGIP